MIRKLVTVLLLAIPAIAVLAASTPATAPAPAIGRNASWDSYKLVVTRNIFSKDRRTASPYRPSYSGQASAPRDADSYVTLTGIVMQSGEPIAFMEDARTGQTARVGVGQKIGTGSVSAISVEGVYFLTGAIRRKITIGDTLAGSPASMAGSTYSSTAPGSIATGTPAASGPAPSQGSLAGESASRPAPADTGNLSIEERMRLRRLQETR